MQHLKRRYLPVQHPSAALVLRAARVLHHQPCSKNNNQWLRGAVATEQEKKEAVALKQNVLVVSGAQRYGVSN
jgi:hypothetical protein